MKRLIAVTVTAAALLACEGPGATGPTLEALHTGLPGVNGATFMTRNVYPGGNLDLIIGATDPNQIPYFVAIVFREVEYTDFHARAKGIADEIVATHPAVIGLQEVPQSLVANETKATVLLGDFNSGPGTDLSTYSVLTDGGFTDTWVEKNRGKAVWTCCQPELLDNPVSTLSQRIDFVLVRDQFPNSNGIVGGVQTAVVGNLPADRVLAPAVPDLGFPA